MLELANARCSTTICWKYVLLFILSLDVFLIIYYNHANYWFVNLTSRELFNKWQAQRWWAENYDKVMELYNVQRFNHQEVPLPTPPRDEDEVSLR